MQSQNETDNIDLSKPLPKSSKSTGHFSEKDCYECLLDIENWLGSCLTGHNPKLPLPKVKGKKKAAAQSTFEHQASQGSNGIFMGPSCAGEVVEYAVKKGWVGPYHLTLGPFPSSIHQ